MKRTDFQCVVGYVCVTLDSLYECVKAEDADPTVREDLSAVFNFLNEAKQHSFEIQTLYKWEDIKKEALNAGKI